MMTSSMDALRRALLALAIVAVLFTAAGCGGQAAAAEPTAEPAAVSVAPAEPVSKAADTVAAKAPAAGASETGALPDRLELPSIEVNIPVVELGWSQKSDPAGQIFSEWDVADMAAGWHKNSALPSQSGNVVLSGHNNIKGAVFRELDQLQRGDRAILYVGDTRYEYAIDKVMIVPETKATPEQRKTNAQWIQPTEDDRLTLVSCWPRSDNTHRIIVVAHRIPSATTSN